MSHTITVDELRKFAEKFVADEPGRVGSDVAAGRPPMDYHLKRNGRNRLVSEKWSGGMNSNIPQEV